jgi:plastocyanin
MRRWLLVMCMAGVIGGLIATLPLSATATSTLPSSGSFTVSDDAFTAAGGGTTVTIAAGGTVDFSYPSGSTTHNVDFGSGSQPTSCTVNGSAQAPPVPGTPTVPGWSATCTFNTDGTYRFHCDHHPSMTGTVQVGEPTTTTDTGTGTGTGTGTSVGDTTTGGSTATTMTMPMNMPMPTTSTSQKTALSPLAGRARTAVKVSGRRGGGQVEGTIRVSHAGEGGHAVITVLASSAALGSGHSKQAVTLGHIRLARLRSGTDVFKLTLKNVARRALTTHRRLSISVQITVAASGAQTVMISRSLVLRP